MAGNFVYTPFAHQELGPLLDEVRGPVDSFPLHGPTQVGLKGWAVSAGELAGVTFADCPAFEDLGQKRYRQEAKRGQEVLSILQETAGVLSIEDRILASQAEARVWQAVLVEAARRAASPRHGKGSGNAPDFYRSLIRQAQDALYPAPERRIPRNAWDCSQLKLKWFWEVAPETM